MSATRSSPPNFARSSAHAETANRRLLEPIDGLAGREVRVGRVLDAREVLPVDEPVTHNSQITLP